MKKYLCMFCILFVAGCVFWTPFSEKPNVKINSKLIGSWSDGKNIRINISKIDKFNYNVIVEHSGSMAPAEIKCDGFLIKFDGVVLLQLKIKELFAYHGKEKKRTNELDGSYLIGVVDNIHTNNFDLYWIVPEALRETSTEYKYFLSGKQEQLTSEMLKTSVKLFIKRKDLMEKSKMVLNKMTASKKS